MSPSAMPCGTWPSPLGAAAVASAARRLEVVAALGESVYWLEGRPSEAGRTALMVRRPNGTVEEVTPPGTNVRTRVHEYGGGACLVSESAIVFSECADQRLYVLGSSEGPIPLTPEGAWRYADVVRHPSDHWLACVREDHRDPTREAEHTIVRLDLDGAPMSAGLVLASGYDFYSTPRFSPDGRVLAWLSWRHPLMPWDGTELWVAHVTETRALAGAHCIAGGADESVVQPAWSPEGHLFFVSDRSGWWNLYRVDRDAVTSERTPAAAQVCPRHADFATPSWQFGQSSYAFAGEGRLVVSCAEEGRRHAALLDTATGAMTPLVPSLEPGATMFATPTHGVFVAGSAQSPDAVVRVDLATGTVEHLREAAIRPLEPEMVSVAQPFWFPTGNGARAHAFYYPPTNSACVALHGECPPLIVISHGGPTAATSPRLSLTIQYWTTRGFAVVDVNYRGSSGFGRDYRNQLRGAWGIADVEDCVNAALFLAAEGKADRQRLVIRGASAGGYTTLQALTTRPDVFAAGASYYGVSDLELLERDTHAFESRYSHSLIAPYPERADVYRARSPIHNMDRLSCPIILFQGTEDTVVPPNQAQVMADAARDRGLAVELVWLEGEQHGFRRADSIVRCLEAELAFYRRVLVRSSTS